MVLVVGGDELFRVVCSSLQVGVAVPMEAAKSQAGKLIALEFFLASYCARCFCQHNLQRAAVCFSVSYILPL